MSVTPQPPLELKASPARSDVGAALRRIGEVVGLGILPIAVLAWMFVVGVQGGPLSGDFHHELYPEAKLLLRGENPFPSPDTPIGGANFVWPPVAGYLVSPLTLLPVGVADIVMVLLGLACFALALWLVGVRDWRVYGVVALWPEFTSEMRVSHLTPVLAVLLAAAWKWRDREGLPGVLVGFAVAVKFFVWPLGVWFIAIGRGRAALVAAVFAAASLLLVLPFTGLDDYVRTLLDLGRTFDQDSYSVFGLLMQLESPETLARVVMLVTGAAVLFYCWRRASFTAAIGAALLLSPIVWLDFYALAAIPLAVVLPRFSLVWLVPLATWGLPSSGIGAGTAWGVTRALIAFTIVLAVTVRLERHSVRDGDRHRATVRPRTNRGFEPRSSPD